jgi:hypothetical protein
MQSTGSSDRPRVADRDANDLSDDELRDYVCEHVIYEITQFVRGVEAVALAKQGRFRENFAVEVFGLHLRNLLDFFYPRPSVRPTDVVAAHFVPAGWDPPPISGVLKEARRRADKEISHLTTDRQTDPEKKQWMVTTISVEVWALVALFVQEATLVCDEFAGHISDRRAELDAALSRKS